MVLAGACYVQAWELMAAALKCGSTSRLQRRQHLAGRLLTLS